MPGRKDAQIHNARAAFVCGLALSTGKHVLMLQEGESTQPIDYRDIVKNYRVTSDIPNIIAETIRRTADAIQLIEDEQIPLPKGLLSADLSAS